MRPERSVRRAAHRASRARVTRSAPLRAARAFAALSFVGLTLAASFAHAAALKVTLLLPQDDARLERNRVERGYLGHPGGPVSGGVEMALKDARFELEAAGVGLALQTVEVADAAAVKAAVSQAEKAGAVALLTDLDPALTLAAVDAGKLTVLNIGEASDRLRQADCRARLLHVIPSERMRADALAQTLAASRWQQVLLLTGPTPADAQRSEVAQAAIKRYGLKLVGSKPFKLSGDPRERDLANPRLLTGGATYDAVWVVDSVGEFARSLPYRTVLPRPVVGDAGLAAVGWHAQFERFGAPQVSRRFAKTQGRPMVAADWAAWMAGKALAGAAVAAPKGGAAFVKALVEGELDGSKGVSMGFRPWDGQLRQPLFLTDGQGVVATAPADGILHPKNTLDTLGADAPEKLCKAK
jgi:ABC transporter substrate binding protein (PQQ-dependent alcohol dehydrogenase system)